MRQSESIVKGYRMIKFADSIISSRFTNQHKKDYEKHVPGEIESTSKGNDVTKYSDLFAYNRSSGTAAIYATDGLGNLSLIKEHSQWSNRPWDIITSGKFSSHDYSDLADLQSFDTRQTLRYPLLVCL